MTICNFTFYTSQFLQVLKKTWFAQPAPFIWNFLFRLSWTISCLVASSSLTNSSSSSSYWRTLAFFFLYNNNKNNNTIRLLTILCHRPYNKAFLIAIWNKNIYINIWTTSWCSPFGKIPSTCYSPLHGNIHYFKLSGLPLPGFLVIIFKENLMLLIFLVQFNINLHT